MSLGVDLVPHKVCSLNCVYCECGATSRHTMDRKEYVPLEELFAEAKDFFDHQHDPDYMTLSGAGEPTLHSGLGRVIAFLKDLRPGVPLAVITNGTLLSDLQVREELMRSDLVLPSLDAATEGAFRKINRPYRNYSVKAHIDGLMQFVREYRGKVWLEVLVLPGYNDGDENLAELEHVIRELGPERVQLNTLDRPGVLKGLRPASRALLERIAASWNLPDVEIIAPFREKHRPEGFREDTGAAILETLSRRPCTLEDIREILGLPELEINKYLGDLEARGKVSHSRQERGVFYRVVK